MADFIYGEYSFKENTCFWCKLIFNIVTPRTYPSVQMIPISFDRNNVPIISSRELPYRIRKALTLHIRQAYPNGFHSRNDTRFKWIRARLQEVLEKDYSVEIKSFEPFGGILVNEDYRDAYKVLISLNGTLTDAIVTSRYYKPDFCMYRKYTKGTDFGFDDVRPDFHETFVAVSEYLFDRNDHLITEKQAVTPGSGSAFDCYLGEFCEVTST